MICSCIAIASGASVREAHAARTKMAIAAITTAIAVSIVFIAWSSVYLRLTAGFILPS